VGLESSLGKTKKGEGSWLLGQAGRWVWRVAGPILGRERVAGDSVRQVDMCGG